MKEQVIIDKLLINYYCFKKDGKKTVIFLHGWRSEGLVWKQAAESLKIDDVAIYALDLPGFGASAIPKEALSIDDYAKIVVDFINKLKLKNIVLVGHSFGGRIAIKLSATHPELIDKLVLVDSAGLIIDSQKKKRREKFAKFFKPLFKPKLMQGIRKNIYQKMGAEDYLATPYIKGTFLKTIDEDLRPYLSQIILPTLIVWGENDIETPLSFAEIMNKEIKGSEKIVFPNAGHFSFLDDAQRFSYELSKFINN